MNYSDQKYIIKNSINFKKIYEMDNKNKNYLQYLLLLLLLSKNESNTFRNIFP